MKMPNLKLQPEIPIGMIFFYFYLPWDYLCSRASCINSCSSRAKYFHFSDARTPHSSIRVYVHTLSVNIYAYIYIYTEDHTILSLAEVKTRYSDPAGERQTRARARVRANPLGSSLSSSFAFERSREDRVWLTRGRTESERPKRSIKLLIFFFVNLYYFLFVVFLHFLVQ